MNVTTPQLPTTEQSQDSGDRPIAYAVLAYPFEFTMFSHSLLAKAVEAMLISQGLETKRVGAYFTKSFSVAMFDVSRNDETAALAALRQILQTVVSPNRYLIAIHTEKDVWTIVHGEHDGNADF